MSMGLFQSPCPYDLKTGLLHKSSIVEGKHQEESSSFFPASNDFPMSDKNKEDTWDQFADKYSLARPGSPSGGADLVGEGSGGSGSFS